MLRAQATQQATKEVIQSQLLLMVGTVAALSPGLDAQVRLRAMPLSEEEIEWVFLAALQPHLIKVNESLRSAVNAAQVDNQRVVDEHEHVVIATEFEPLFGGVVVRSRA